MGRPWVTSAVLAALACAPGAARAQHLDMFVGSTLAGGGELALDYDFGPPVTVVKSFEGAGQALYVNTDPGWNHPPPAGSLFALPTGTPLTVELTAADPGASIKIGAAVLDLPGEAASLGNAGVGAPHVHPVWQLVLPSGVGAERSVSFTMRTSSGAYAQSATYTLRLTNTTTSTSTTLGATSTSTSSTSVSSTSSTSTSLASTSTTAPAPATTSSSSTLPSTSSTTSTTSSSSSTSPVPTTTSSTLPFVDQPLAGDKLILRDDARRPAKRQAMVLSKDGELTLDLPGSAGDPTIDGAWLTLTGTPGVVLAQELPAAGWKLVGKPTSPKGYRYDDAKGVFGPVTSVLVKARKLVKIIAKGDGLALSLAEDPRPVDVELELGTRRYCLAFGGTGKLTPGTKLLAKGSPPPATCTLP